MTYLNRWQSSLATVYLVLENKFLSVSWQLHHPAVLDRVCSCHDFPVPWLIPSILHNWRNLIPFSDLFLSQALFLFRKNSKSSRSVSSLCPCFDNLLFPTDSRQFVHVRPSGSFCWITIAAIFRSKWGLATTSKPHFQIIMEVYLGPSSADTLIFVKQTFASKQAQISPCNLFSELSEVPVICAFICSDHILSEKFTGIRCNFILEEDPIRKRETI